MEEKPRNANPQSRLSGEEPVVQEAVNDSDNECLVALAAGDSSLFPSLVDRWQSPLINFFYRSTQNRNDAEDLAQETFIDIYKAATHYENKGTSKAFIFTLARRRLIDRYRKQTRRPLNFIDPSDSLMQKHSNPMDASLEIEEAFQQALKELPEKQRSAILLLQQQGLSYDEIAVSLKTSRSSVKTWIHRARVHLRQKLKDFV